MNYEVNIRSNHAKVSLREVLANIPGEKYNWNIEHVYAIGILSGPYTMLQLEEKVNGSRNGLSVSWEYLKEFAKNLDDAFDLVIVAKREVCEIELGIEIKDAKIECLVIELFDSCFWRLKTDCKELMKVFSNFPTSEVVSIGKAK